ncbi:MAG: vitamin K epoxide reductase family protein, partial [Microbacterium gubbeenense]
WCMTTWAVTIPTFFATVVHLFRNGTFSSSEKVQERAGRLMAWVPLATIVAYAIIIAMAQLKGIDFLGEITGLIF